MQFLGVHSFKGVPTADFSTHVKLRKAELKSNNHLNRAPSLLNFNTSAPFILPFFTWVALS